MASEVRVASVIPTICSGAKAGRRERLVKLRGVQIPYSATLIRSGEATIHLCEIQAKFWEAIIRSYAIPPNFGVATIRYLTILVNSFPNPRRRCKSAPSVGSESVSPGANADHDGIKYERRPFFRAAQRCVEFDSVAREAPSSLPWEGSEIACRHGGSATALNGFRQPVRSTRVRTAAGLPRNVTIPSSLSIVVRDPEWARVSPVAERVSALPGFDSSRKNIRSTSLGHSISRALTLNSD